MDDLEADGDLQEIQAELDKARRRWKRSKISTMTNYPGSVVILCSQDDGTVDAIVVGRFASGNLDMGTYAPGYRLNINLDAGTIATVQKIPEDPQ
jgi:hypothetical protein